MLVFQKTKNIWDIMKSNKREKFQPRNPAMSKASKILVIYIILAFQKFLTIFNPFDSVLLRFRCGKKQSGVSSVNE